MHRFRTKNHPDDLLGCRLTNHRYSSHMDVDGVTVQGSYDIHVWYSYSGVGDEMNAGGDRMHTAVSVQTVEFEEHLPVQYIAGTPGSVANAVCRIVASRHPRSTEVSVDADGVVQVAVEDGYGTEIIGETMLVVPVYASAGGEFGDDKKKGFETWEAADGEFEDDFEDDVFDDFDDEDVDETAAEREASF